MSQDSVVKLNRPAANDLEGELAKRLTVHRDRLWDEPASNPVWQLACDLSHWLESGEIDRAALFGLTDELFERSLADRAGWLRAALGVEDHAASPARLTAQIEASANGAFEDFAARWSRERLGCVFTAHPTFLLNDSDTARLVAAATGAQAPAPGADAGFARASISLEREHALALAAIGNADAALRTTLKQILATAQNRFPDRWRDLRPAPFAISTWVGYDLDGRTDIEWTDCLRFRLGEKRLRLGDYCGAMEGIVARAGDGPIAAALQDIAADLTAALDHTDRAIALFGKVADGPDALSAAANWLSDEAPGRLISLTDIIDRLTACLAEVEDDALALEIALLRAEMRIFSLGAARLHFRLNTTQVHNAIRRRLQVNDDDDLTGRSARALLNKMTKEVSPVTVNFAALAVETTTAVRQFLTITQILKHIDADADIRLLIAECEQPVTVLAAVYFARLFGVDGKVDVSPLFETPAALENSARFFDVLFSQSAYRNAARLRNRIAIQTGFSDAGRFVGQIPAALTIERLQGRLARFAEKHGLNDVEILIFNTHGESMGRGGHPRSIDCRIRHVFSEWADRQFAERGMTVHHEVSFQGGDGYLWFGSEALALSVFCRVLESGGDAAGDDAPDPFYEEVDASLDFFRRIKRFQEELFHEPFYGRALSAIGMSLLPPTGSRKTRRQFEVAGDQSHGMSRVRAIPHNAILQQLGYPVNVVGGIGTAIQAERDRFVDLCGRSTRARSLISLVAESRRLASLKTLRAYGNLFDGAYWATRPYGGRESELLQACRYLADLLEGDDRFGATKKLATRLRIDELMLRQFLDELGEGWVADFSDERNLLAMLHATRIALIQHIFLLVARIPRFSERNDISREDIMELVFELRIPEAVESLRIAYPCDPMRLEDFDMAESSEYPDEAAPNYAEINARLIDPMEQTYAYILKISSAIANAFRAHG